MRLPLAIVISLGVTLPGWCVPSVGLGDSNALLWGKWKFIGYIYEGVFQPPPNPNLILTFEFFEDGTDVLKWYRINEPGFCERRGRYSFDGEQLTDHIFWVNPKNAFECMRDPDMTPGRTQVTALRREDNELHMDLPLSEQTLTYVWGKQESTAEASKKLPDGYF